MPKAVLPDLGRPEVAHCPICGTSMTRTLRRFDFDGRLFGYFPADVCKTGHDFLTDESDEAIEGIAQKLGIMGKGASRRRHRSSLREVAKRAGHA